MPLFLEPVLQEKMWGGTALAQYGYQLPNHHIGECWGISAHPHGMSVVTNQPYQGETLANLWDTHPELFGHPKQKTFPLLTKILDAHTCLSVQVHPDDTYAWEHEKEYGKTECWYILEAEPGAEIIYGVNAETHTALCEAIDNQDFDTLLKRVPVKPGEFYYVPAGTVHGIGSGIVILETQQSSDTTYRLYDYDRRDANGELRPLHLAQSKDVIRLHDETRHVTPIETMINHQRVTTFVANEFFTVKRIDIEGTMSFEKPHDYVLCSVIDGQGTVTVDDCTYDLVKGSHFIFTATDDQILVEGRMSWIISYTE